MMCHLFLFATRFLFSHQLLGFFRARLRVVGVIGRKVMADLWRRAGVVVLRMWWAIPNDEKLNYRIMLIERSSSRRSILRIVAQGESDISLPWGLLDYPFFSNTF